jgi:hypothetical protein
MDHDLHAVIASLQAALDDFTTLHPAEEHDGKTPVLWWIEIPDRETGRVELVCAGLMSQRSFPGLKKFTKLPPLKDLPCPIAHPQKRPAPRPMRSRVPKTSLAQRRKPGMKLDGTPRKPRSTPARSTTPAGT